MNDDIKAIGMSAAERHVRNALARLPTQPDDQSFHTTTGVMRTLMHDLDMWREITSNEIDKWSFNALLAMAKRILDKTYPEAIFPRLAMPREFDPTDTGPYFVQMLREVIREIEKDDAIRRSAGGRR
ncbi:hypothetical protein EHM76_00270 [bacterium]|nr:MAG: hypothetical protein EHM84_06820 [Xanthomonadales bacterium]RPH76021.1 MAG: hypothetical protein EHM76_00270 [bacterium]